VDSFSTVEVFLPKLKLYCRTLAGNEWDAEDLLQEVLTKAHRSLQQMPDRNINQAFLRRIAKNAWIDHCRKQQVLGISAVFDEDVHQNSSIAANEMLIRESLELLADQLNPRQMVLILLIDIFQFRASEAAKLLHATEGAIKEGLKRARHRLQALVSKSEEEGAKKKEHSINKKLQSDPVITKEVFEQFLSAFRAGDAEGICRTYLTLASKGIQIEKVTHSAGRYFFTFRDPNGHLIGFFQEI
jgi:RNA polymerase sigma factor (sigma-70 family)